GCARAPRPPPSRADGLGCRRGADRSIRGRAPEHPDGSERVPLRLRGGGPPGRHRQLEPRRPPVRAGPRPPPEARTRLPRRPALSDYFYGWAKAAYELLGLVYASGALSRRVEVASTDLGATGCLRAPLRGQTGGARRPG